MARAWSTVKSGRSRRVEYEAHAWSPLVRGRRRASPVTRPGSAGADAVGAMEAWSDGAGPWDRRLSVDTLGELPRTLDVEQRVTTSLTWCPAAPSDVSSGPLLIARTQARVPGVQTAIPRTGPVTPRFDFFRGSSRIALRTRHFGRRWLLRFRGLHASVCRSHASASWWLHGTPRTGRNWTLRVGLLGTHRRSTVRCAAQQ